MIESAQHHPALQNPVKAAEGWKGQTCVKTVDKLQEWMTKKNGNPNKKIFLDILGVTTGFLELLVRLFFSVVSSARKWYSHIFSHP